MKLSTKARYGLRAVLEIAKSYGGIPVKRKDIALKQGISDSYLENLLIILKNNRLIESIRGVNGGYTLSRNPAEIVVYDVITSLEGPFEIADCTGASKICEHHLTCSVSKIWNELFESWAAILYKYTIQDLLDIEKQTGTSDYNI